MLKTRFKNSKELLKVLGTAENIIRRNQTSNKLQYIKLEKAGDRLLIVARNPYMRLGYYIENTLNIEGDSSLYDCKILTSLLNVLKDEIEIDDKEIKSEKCTYKIPSYDVEGYPEDILPDIVNRKEIDTQDFKEALEAVFCATQKSEYENALSGVYIDKNKLVACDGNRIFFKQIATELDNVILSKETINELLRLPFQDKIYMSIFGENIIFEDENLYLASNFLSMDYPKYEGLIPKDIENEVEFKKSELENALNLITPIINQDTFKCTLELTNEKMLVSTENIESKAETEIEIKLKKQLSEPLKIMFNINYLQDMLKANKEDIKIIINSQKAGYKFISDNAEQYIMSMQNN